MATEPVHGFALPCRRCGAGLRKGARFCAGCGSPTSEERNQQRDEVRDQRQRTTGAVRSVAIGFAGTLAIVVLGGWLAAFQEDPGIGVRFAQVVGILIVAGLAGLPLRPEPVQPVFSLRPSKRALLDAVGAGLAALAVSTLYVLALGSLFRTDGDPPAHVPMLPPPLHLRLLVVGVLVPLVEEFLCRGVLWEALGRIAPPRTVLLLTSALFAMLHGLGGLWLLEMPHRFVAGLLFGLVRRKHGSVLVPVVSHAVLNLSVTLLAGSS